MGNIWLILSQSKKCATSSSLNIALFIVARLAHFWKNSKIGTIFRILEKISVVSPQKIKMKGLATV